MQQRRVPAGASAGAGGERRTGGSNGGAAGGPSGTDLEGCTVTISAGASTGAVTGGALGWLGINLASTPAIFRRN